MNINAIRLFTGEMHVKWMENYKEGSEKLLIQNVDSELQCFDAISATWLSAAKRYKWGKYGQYY